MKVLLVDDDLVDRKHIERTLKRGNKTVEIVETKSVDDAIVQLSKQEFDIVLCDYNMPRKNGMAMIEAIKENNSSSPALGTATIIISTSEDDELAMKCLEAGAQDFLTKTDISGFRLRRAIASAQTRFKLEQKLQRSYEKIQILAEQDGLTKLANRHMFDERLSQVIAKQKRTNERISLILLDLDHFKDVNDNYGHDVGDELLIRVVNRIRGCLRGDEIFARLGGDEFAVVLPDLCSVDIADKVSRRILKVLEKPFRINKSVLSIGASIGIAFSPDNARNSTELFKFADIAMYKAKALGRNQLAFFEDDMQRQFLARLEIESRLTKAVKTNAFELYYQPVYSGHELIEIGHEALIRWKAGDPPMGPDEFIPIAEEMSLIHELGRWIINEAIEQFSKWSSVNSKTRKMAINLSPVQLADGTLTQYIESCLQKYKVAPESIEFELTETALLDHSNKTIEIIESISALGCKIALDDFGTGFSSISHLHQFPINTVKIDRSLLPTNENSEKEIKLLKGLVAMINSLELNIVAEGVETREQVNFCQSLGIHCLQGYFLSRPLSVKNIEQLRVEQSKRSISKGNNENLKAS